MIKKLGRKLSINELKCGSKNAAYFLFQHLDNDGFSFSFFSIKLNFEQTNVFANAQKRKVRPFEGMQRKAIVIVPSEEDFKARTEAQEKAECKDVPDNAVMEMKGINNYLIGKT